MDKSNLSHLIIQSKEKVSSMQVYSLDNLKEQFDSSPFMIEEILNDYITFNTDYTNQLIYQVIHDLYDAGYLKFTNKSD
ncbi:hypothetical protein [Enterococcus raffinosus]|uniref:Uncharacterized protein n=1 Tax=Enterococcus raffinosus TaxID=71452 RepID=A0AAW8TCJ4_9ENTE|nr:hypothetical protein [Enterococcus raffinosus]MDT2521720.1 hypothetical protein [Enterococcus raffinosus]MDT2531991.1 hypothetical protein [Enterococcus raffinosus]MDT2532765.1 hypothetical protein [Enterococcus raffinosus]MDT2545516.1 hypothetical protein [Enterococcus raffinosus]MDT2554658.1 hypothetical protein [Enterococcus raffinosus]